MRFLFTIINTVNQNFYNIPLNIVLNISLTIALIYLCLIYYLYYANRWITDF